MVVGPRSNQPSWAVCSVRIFPLGGELDPRAFDNAALQQALLELAGAIFDDRLASPSDAHASTFPVAAQYQHGGHVAGALHQPAVVQAAEPRQREGDRPGWAGIDSSMKP